MWARHAHIGAVPVLAGSGDQLVAAAAADQEAAEQVAAGVDAVELLAAGSLSSLFQNRGRSQGVVASLPH
jgi:hypothetical protein